MEFKNCALFTAWKPEYSAEKDYLLTGMLYDYLVKALNYDVTICCGKSKDFAYEEVFHVPMLFSELTDMLPVFRFLKQEYVLCCDNDGLVYNVDVATGIITQFSGQRSKFCEVESNDYPEYTQDLATGRMYIIAPETAPEPEPTSYWQAGRNYRY